MMNKEGEEQIETKIKDAKVDRLQIRGEVEQLQAQQKDGVTQKTQGSGGTTETVATTISSE